MNVFYLKKTFINLPYLRRKSNFSVTRDTSFNEKVSTDVPSVTACFQKDLSSQI